MCEDITEKKWAAQVQRVHSQMASYVQPYLASISRTYDNIHAQHHGSGVYLELNSDRYLLTCEHVVRTGYENGNRITHLPKANSYYHSFPTEWRAVPFPVDLAINHIVPDFWSQSDRQFLPLSRIAETHDVTPNELLMLCGYRGRRLNLLYIPAPCYRPRRFPIQRVRLHCRPPTMPESTLLCSTKCTYRNPQMKAKGTCLRLQGLVVHPSGTPVLWRASAQMIGRPHTRALSES